MPLTPEEQAKLKELQDKELAEAKVLDEAKIKALKDDEKDALIIKLTEDKRAANAEAKAGREDKEAREKADKEAEMKSDELVKTRDAEIIELNKRIASGDLKSKAVTELTGKGFPIDIVEISMNGLTDEGYKKSVDNFEKKFEAYKTKPGQANVPGRTDKPGDKTPDIIKQQNTGKAAVMDLRNNEAINTARDIAEKEKLLGG